MRFLSRAGGSQVSLTVGLLGTFLSVFIGAIVGALSESLSGWVDTRHPALHGASEVVPKDPAVAGAGCHRPAELANTWVYSG